MKRDAGGGRAAEFAVEAVEEICARLGEEIRSARDRAGVTQAELGRIVGLSRPSVANLEAGRQDITVSRLVLVARALDLELNLADLVGEDALERIAVAREAC